MSTAQAINEFSLNLSRTINAPRQRVYDAWLDAEALTHWFSPSPDMGVVVHELDPREGGRYRIEMNNPDGEAYIVSGEYVRLSAPAQLVFTWSWEHEPDDLSLVTVDLTDQGDRTELNLHHEKLPSQNSCDLHIEGWEGCLDRLLEYANNA